VALRKCTLMRPNLSTPPSPLGVAPNDAADPFPGDVRNVCNRLAGTAGGYLPRTAPSQPIPNSNCSAASVSGFVQRRLSAILTCLARPPARNAGFPLRALDTSEDGG
jgi:hypothetical protein